MKYHFYRSVSLSILVGTTREDWCPNCRLWNDETSLRPRLIGSLFLSIRGGGPCFFCGLSLIPVSLFFPLHFILLAQTKSTLPTNAAAAFQGQASGCWGKETTGKEHGGCEDRGEERMQFQPPQMSLAAPSSQYPTSRRPYSETHLMNTPALIQPHNGVLHYHWAGSQWRTSLQLNPRDNEPG